jgi:hypothetical protein
VAGGWRRLNREEFDKLYASPHIFFKALTVLRGPLANPHGLLELHIDIW